MGRKDLTGQTFGDLIVIEYSSTSPSGKALWKCRCKCGKETIVSGDNLRNAHTTSCGCAKHIKCDSSLTSEKTRENYHAHKQSKTHLYGVWSELKRRCDPARASEFPYYAGKGVSVCDEWKTFPPFYEWSMANGYQKGLTIDRVDFNGGYCPENCRWVSQKIQVQNRSTSRFVEIEGVTKCIKAWCEDWGIPYGAVMHRVYRGACEKDALLTVKAKYSKQ